MLTQGPSSIMMSNVPALTILKVDIRLSEMCFWRSGQRLKIEVEDEGEEEEEKREGREKAREAIGNNPSSAGPSE